MDTARGSHNTAAASTGTYELLLMPLLLLNRLELAQFICARHISAHMSSPSMPRLLHPRTVTLAQLITRQADQPFDEVGCQRRALAVTAIVHVAALQRHMRSGRKQ